uniref:Uncharacterized protein n=1 Tax=Anguilla anguilla TaxID=7936 RepID=A0A0E9PTL1_ANGAN
MLHYCVLSLSRVQHNYYSLMLVLQFIQNDSFLTHPKSPPITYF